MHRILIANCEIDENEVYDLLQSEMGSFYDSVADLSYDRSKEDLEKDLGNVARELAERIGGKAEGNTVFLPAEDRKKLALDLAAEGVRNIEETIRLYKKALRNKASSSQILGTLKAGLRRPFDESFIFINDGIVEDLLSLLCASGGDFEITVEKLFDLHY